MGLRRIATSPWLKLTATLIVGTIIIVAAVVVFYPKSEEQFIAMGVLGENGTTDHYFPGNASGVVAGTMVRWHVYIYNHMDVAVNISIRVKLLNSTQQGPSDAGRTSSPVSPFFEIPIRLSKNETTLIPFFFEITQVTLTNQSVSITRMTVNNVPVSLHASALQGRSFRLVFELWSYNEGSKVFEFSAGSNIPVWNQIWFDVNT